MTNKKQNIALIVAGGRGQRAGDGPPKQYRKLPDQDETVLTKTMRIFLSHENVDGVCAIIHKDDIAIYKAACADIAHNEKLLPYAFGGDTRQTSVSNGLDHIATFNPNIVLIHDAARAYVEHSLVDRGFDALAQATKNTYGAIPTIEITDTVKRVKKNQILETIDRETIVRAQTPQFFLYKKIKAAHLAVKDKDNYTDDAAIAEAAKIKLVTFLGDTKNIKLTHEEDFMPKFVSSGETRTGFGYDVHAFDHTQEASHIRLCGIDVPHDKCLTGHSDADVGLHALCDALFGALALDDIGAHFPPTSVINKNRDSSEFVTFAVQKMHEKSASLINADITIICERPKVGPHRQVMRARVADLLGVDIDRVSIKATTTEKLGFTGRKEGIAAQAVVSVKTM